MHGHRGGRMKKNKLVEKGWFALKQGDKFKYIRPNKISIEVLKRYMKQKGRIVNVTITED